MSSLKKINIEYKIVMLFIKCKLHFEMVFFIKKKTKNQHYKIYIFLYLLGSVEPTELITVSRSGG